MDVRSELHGNESINCPVPETCKNPCDGCHDDCQHTREVLALLPLFMGGSKKIASLLMGLLKLQEQTINHWCDFSHDVGEIYNFPKVQCGKLVIPDGCGSHQSCGDCDVINVHPVSCGDYSEIDILECAVQSEIDFNSELSDLYDTMLAALLSFNGQANLAGMSQMIQSLFGLQASVCFDVEKYIINIGRDLTCDEARILPIFKKLIPVPVGSDYIIVVPKRDSCNGL